MKKIKFKDIKELNLKDLLKKKTSLKKELFDLKMKHCLGQLTNPLEIRYKRRQLARYETSLRGKR